jgi:hypothetical protein
MYSQDARGEQRRLLGRGDDGIFDDAWGRQKIVFDHSLFHGVFTYDIPNVLWIEYFNGIEQPKANATSVNGMLKLVSNGGSSFLMGKRHPRYQPNRGHLYSTAFNLDNATMTNGKLYAVVRTKIDGVVYEDRQPISFKGLEEYDPSKGNIYDIQMQWRGVGGIKFFVNQKELYHFNYLGTLDELSVSNPALPASFECDNLGNIRAGAFAPEFGVCFEWEFNTPQETQLRVGCVDITSEGGSDEGQQFVSIVGEELTISDAPILAVRIPEIFQGQMNTRDLQLHKIKAITDKKGTIGVYITRDTTSITTALTWQSINGGNIEALIPTSSGDITFDDTKALKIDVIPVQPGTNNFADNPNPDIVKFFLTHGDYLVLVGDGAQATMRAIIQVGEEL